MKGPFPPRRVRSYMDGWIWSAGGHVDEAAVVALERDGDGRGRAVTVLGHDQVRLARPRRFLLVGILAVQEDYDVGILFYTIMQVCPIYDKIVRFENRGVED